MQKNIFEDAVCHDVIARLNRLTPETARQWGTMDAPQMLAHLSIPLQTGMGLLQAKSVYVPIISPLFIQYLMRGGKFFKGKTPTMKEFVVSGNPDFVKEKQALEVTLKEFIALGKAGKLTKHPFFGKMNPTEWGIVTYSHIDHHLRQFGV